MSDLTDQNLLTGSMTETFQTRARLVGAYDETGRVLFDVPPRPFGLSLHGIDLAGALTHVKWELEHAGVAWAVGIYLVDDPEYGEHPEGCFIYRLGGCELMYCSSCVEGSCEHAEGSPGLFPFWSSGDAREMWGDRG